MLHFYCAAGVVSVVGVGNAYRHGKVGFWFLGPMKGQGVHNMNGKKMKC